jgi:hypothetical protein
MRWAKDIVGREITEHTIKKICDAIYSRPDKHWDRQKRIEQIWSFANKFVSKTDLF